MIPIGWDTETHLIKPGLLAPRLVCASWAARDGEGFRTDLLSREGGLWWLRERLADGGALLVGANSPYDLGVAAAEDESFLVPIFDAYRAGRVCCVQTRQKLLDVALGMRKWRRVRGRVERAAYGLDDLVALYFDEHLEKVDTWRLRYAELDGVPIGEWPPEAREYAVGDAVQALWVWEAQSAEIRELFGGELPDEAPQQRAAWALHLMSMWGVRAERAAVDHFVEHCEREIEAMRERIQEMEAEEARIARAAGREGFAPVFKSDRSRTMAAIRARVIASCERRSVDVPRTDPSPKFPDGQVGTDREVLESTDDPVLLDLAENTSFQKHLDQWGPVCRAAVDRPVCARYNVLVDNGRTSCSGSEGQEGTNFQNPPRKGDVRPCFVPRPGWVFCSTDADTIELRALAQACLELVGFSRMAEVLWKQFKEGGPDLHVTLGAGIAGVTPAEAHALHLAKDEAFAAVRQIAKNCNFGLAGGMGAEKFVLLCHALGVRLADTWEKEVERAIVLRAIWFETWEEMRPYFRVVGDMLDPDTRRGTIVQLQSGRIRGDANFTAAANSLFSGRVADGEKEILWRLADECYTGRLTGSRSGRSVLYGSRPVMFLHDEPILEHPEATASERAERQREIVVETLQKWLPDVPVTSTAVLMRRWQKGADALRVDGRLVPVRPESYLGADGKKKTRWVHDLGDLGVEAAHG